MKKNLLKRSSIFVALLVLTTIFAFDSVRAETLEGTRPKDNSVLEGTNGSSMSTLQNPLKVGTLGELIDLVLGVVTYLAIIVAVLMLIWTGFMFIFARGNPNKLKEEGNRLKWIVIGIAIVLGARLAVSIILSTLEATGTLDPNVVNNARQVIKGKQ